MVESAEEASGANERFWRFSNPICWGLFATGLVVSGGGYLAFVEVCSSSEFGFPSCRSKWKHFLASAPNEVGDTLAGFAGALAFVWIITTVWLQSQELSEQRKVLKDQKQEIELQRQATEQMAKALSDQASTEARKLNYQTQTMFDDLVEEKLEVTKDLFLSFQKHEQTWTIEADKSIGQSVETLQLSKQGFSGSAARQFMSAQVDHLKEVEAKLNRAATGKGFKVKPHQEQRFFDIIKALESLLAAAHQGTQACNEKIQFLQIQEALEVCQRLQLNKSLWHPREKLEVDS